MIAIGAIAKEYIYFQVLFELKEILFAFPENAPECVDVNVKRLILWHTSSVHPHIVFVGRRTGVPSFAVATDAGWCNSEMLCDFLEIWDYAKNAQ